jgi:hypothetical protein
MFLSGTTSTSTGSSTSACPIRLWSGLYTLRIRPNLSILYFASRYDESVNCVHGSMWLNGFILSSFLHVFTCGTSVVSSTHVHFLLRAPEPVKVWIFFWRRISLRRIDSSLDSTMSFHCCLPSLLLVNLSYTDAFSWLLNSVIASHILQTSLEESSSVCDGCSIRTRAQHITGMTHFQIDSL